MYRRRMVLPGQVLDPPAFVRLAANPVRWQLLTALAAGDHRVRELVAFVGQPQNLVSYHLRLLRDGGLVTTTRSTFDGRDTYYHLALDRCADELASAGAALHPALTPAPAPPAGPITVLFVCTGNSARSPIAEELLRHRSGGRVAAASAGTQPKDRFHPAAERVLRDTYDLDLSGRRPRHLDSVARRRFDYVITLCDKAREVAAGSTRHLRRVHWSIPDPAARGDFQETAREIDTRVRHLLPVLAATPTEGTEP
jgi:protein-tyrosine-phosphatase